jgi:hypothetical protein
VQDEMIDFFASGHPLVEGLLAHFADSRDGRVGRVELSIDRAAGAGVAVIYADGPRFEVVAVDSSGPLRPDWGAAFHKHPLPLRPLRAQKGRHDEWSALVPGLDRHLDRTREPQMVVAVVVRPE